MATPVSYDLYVIYYVYILGIDILLIILSLSIDYSFSASISGTPTDPDGGFISRYAAIVAAMSWRFTLSAY